MKIAVIGYSGSGKSTLAKYLGELYHIPILYLDKVQFIESWKEREKKEAKAMVAAFMEQDSWVIDGNYGGFYQKERLKEADKIIFMNFGRFQCLYRAWKRYHRYKDKARESMADGCIEKLDREFIWWILYQGRTKAKRKHYKEIIDSYKEKTAVIKNQKQLDRFMKQEGQRGEN